MPVGIGIGFEQYKAPTTPVAIVRESSTIDIAIEESFLTHDSVPPEATVTIRGKTHPILPIHIYTVKEITKDNGEPEEALEGRQLNEGEQYRILLNNEYRFYKLIENELVNLSDGKLIEGVVSTLDKNSSPVTSSTPVENLEENKKYLIAGVVGLLGQSYTIVQSINGIKVVEDLKENTILYNERLATFQFYRNGMLQDYSQPVPYSFFCGTNIKLYEDDGTTKRIIPRSEVIPFLPKENGYPVDFPTTISVVFTVALGGQVDSTQNLVYVFRELNPNSGFSWSLNPPFNVLNLQRPNGFESALFQRGDGYQGVVYRLISNPPFYNAQTRQYFTRINWNPKSLSTQLKWEKIDPSGDTLKILEEKLKTAEDKILLLESQLNPIYTGVAPITAKNKCRIIIDGPGDIHLWVGAATGDFFKISDPEIKLTTISPSVMPEDGYTINGETGPYSLSAIKADWEYDRNLFFRLDNNKNWIVGRI